MNSFSLKTTMDEERYKDDIIRSDVEDNEDVEDDEKVIIGLHDLGLSKEEKREYVRCEEIRNGKKCYRDAKVKLEYNGNILYRCHKHKGRYIKDNTTAITTTNDNKIIVEEKVLPCIQIKTNGLPCGKPASMKLTYKNETFMHCLLHHNKLMKKYSNVIPEDMIITKLKKVVTKRLKFEDMIVKESILATQCCIRTRKNQPLCDRVVTFKIKGKYFCSIHAKKHPNYEEGKRTQKFHGKLAILHDICDRLSKIEKSTVTTEKWIQYMMQFEGFRSAVYAIKTDGDKSALLTVDQVVDQNTVKASAKSDKIGQPQGVAEPLDKNI